MHIGISLDITSSLYKGGGVPAGYTILVARNAATGNYEPVRALNSATGNYEIVSTRIAA